MHVLKKFLYLSSSHLVESNEEEFSAVRVLVQHLCMKVPEQAEFRNSVGKVILQYLLCLILSSDFTYCFILHVF